MNGGQLVIGEAAWPTDVELRKAEAVKAERRAAAAAEPDAPSAVDAGLLPDGAHARRSDPETSHAAAASIPSDRLRASQAAVLSLFDRHPRLADAGIADLYITFEISRPRQSPSGLRTRRRELVDLGYLQDSGERVTLPSGRRSIVWERKPPGGDQ